MPVTVADGTSATAIATPTIISGMAVIRASPPAIPSIFATRIALSRSFVLDSISGVISIETIIDNTKMMALANNIEDEMSLTPKIIDCLTSWAPTIDANRYSIREWNHNAKDRKYDYNSTAIFNDFVRVVNSQSRYNNNTGGIINAIPLVAYHNIDNNMPVIINDSLRTNF